MAKWVTARDVFKARRYYLKHPTIPSASRYEKLYKAYRRRYPFRDLDFYNYTVHFL